MKFYNYFIIVIMFIFCRPSLALNIPNNLTRSDLDELVKILGFNTSSKFLSNPFPLGGYSGFEIGLAQEFINVTDLAKLGSGASQQTYFEYKRISIGKGLYNNLDLFIDFIPFSNSNEISEYGGIIKWNFYQGKFLPFSASILTQASTINIQDVFINETLGWDIMGGINLTHLALYFGGGGHKASSTFSSKILDASVGASSAYSVKAGHSHSFIGIQIDIAKLFLAAQIDRYDQPVYSAKLGIRF